MEKEDSTEKSDVSVFLFFPSPLFFLLSYVARCSEGQKKSVTTSLPLTNKWEMKKIKSGKCIHTVGGEGEEEMARVYANNVRKFGGGSFCVLGGGALK